jgi:hypothetical protein
VTVSPPGSPEKSATRSRSLRHRTRCNVMQATLRSPAAPVSPSTSWRPGWRVTATCATPCISGPLPASSAPVGHASSTTLSVTAGRTTTPPCVPWATAGSKSCGTASSKACPMMKKFMSPTATAPLDTPPNPEVDKGCLTSLHLFGGMNPASLRKARPPTLSTGSIAGSRPTASASARQNAPTSMWSTWPDAMTSPIAAVAVSATAHPAAEACPRGCSDFGRWRGGQGKHPLHRPQEPA